MKRRETNSTLPTKRFKTIIEEDENQSDIENAETLSQYSATSESTIGSYTDSQHQSEQEFDFENNLHLENEDYREEDNNVPSHLVETTQSKTRNKKSKLSKFFHIQGNRINKVGECLLCKNKGSSVNLKMTDGNTTGLKRHLQSAHKKEYSMVYDGPKSTQQTITEVFNSNTKCNISHTHGRTNMPFNKEHFEEKMINWVIAKYLPFSFFDDDRTKELFLYLNKNAITPGRNSLRNKILDRFNSKQAEVMKILKENKSNISFTIDGWTSVAYNSFYGITAHFIDDQWKLKSIVLDFVPSNGRHTGLDIAVLMNNVVSNFEIKNKMQGITLDNVSANTTFLNEFSKILANENIEFDCHDQHFRCFAHILNLGAQEAIKLLKIEINDSEELIIDTSSETDNDETDDADNVYSTIHKLRQLIKKLKQSEQIRNKFKSCCDTCSLDIIIPPLDVKTRWNSTYLMISQATKMKEPLNLLCSINSDLIKYKLNTEEWLLLSGISSFLKHFYTLTEILGGENYVTLPLVVIGFNMLIDKIEKNVQSLDNKLDRNNIDETLLLAFQASRDKLLRYYNKLNWIYCAVLIIDPRHKLETFELTSWGQEMLQQSKEKFESIFQNHYYQPTNVLDTTPEQQDTDDIDVRSLFGSKRLEHDANCHWRQELDSYYTTTTKATKDEDVLQWWRYHQHLYPNLARMAKDLLSVPATSVPAERLFSKASLTLRKHRNRLNPKSARALLCLNSWINQI